MNLSLLYNTRLLGVSCRQWLLPAMLLISAAASAQPIKPYYGPFPKPPQTEHSLFYLQRTMDVNTVMYEINYKAGGQINRVKPVKVYWIDYADNGKISPLTFVQNKLAYGIEAVELPGPELSFKINLVSYKKISMYLKPTGKNGSYETHVILEGKTAILSSILVHITGGTHMRPQISHIELRGRETGSGKELVEKIKP